MRHVFGYGFRSEKGRRELLFPLSSDRGTDRMRRITMKLRGALLTAGMLALPMVASAQPVTGLYISGGAGVNLM
jgi:hypothetical protein